MSSSLLALLISKPLSSFFDPLHVCPTYLFFVTLLPLLIICLRCNFSSSLKLFWYFATKEQDKGASFHRVGIGAMHERRRINKSFGTSFHGAPDFSVESDLVYADTRIPR